MSDQPYSLDQILSMGLALDAEDARMASRKLAEQRRAAERWHEQAVKDAGIAEGDYRKAFGQEYVKAEGTVGEREAKARAQTAHLAQDRDIKKGMVRVAQERLQGLEGERSMLKSLIDWSARMSDDTRSGRNAQAVEQYGG